MKKKETIAIDFDGVIHKYSKGWQDGSIYDEANSDVIKWMYKKMNEGHPVFIFTARPKKQVVRWMNEQFPYFGAMAYDTAFALHGIENAREVESIPFWKKFWNTNKVLGVTNKKLPAHIYIDDRAFKFTGDNINDVDKML